MDQTYSAGHGTRTTAVSRALDTATTTTTPATTTIPHYETNPYLNTEPNQIRPTLQRPQTLPILTKLPPLQRHQIRPILTKPNNQPLLNDEEPEQFDTFSPEVTSKLQCLEDLYRGYTEEEDEDNDMIPTQSTNIMILPTSSTTKPDHTTNDMTTEALTEESADAEEVEIDPNDPNHFNFESDQNEQEQDQEKENPDQSTKEYAIWKFIDTEALHHAIKEHINSPEREEAEIAVLENQREIQTINEIAGMADLKHLTADTNATQEQQIQSAYMRLKEYIAAITWAEWRKAETTKWNTATTRVDKMRSTITNQGVPKGRFKELIRGLEILKKVIAKITRDIRMQIRNEQQREEYRKKTSPRRPAKKQRTKGTIQDINKHLDAHEERQEEEEEEHDQANEDLNEELYDCDI